MIARPFPTRSTRGAAPKALEVRVWFAPAAPPASQCLDTLDRLMMHFTRVAAEGALADARLPPAQASLVLVAKHIAADVCVWNFDSVQVASCGRTVLENIVHYFHLTECPVRSLELIVPPGSELARAGDLATEPFVRPPFAYLFEPESPEVVTEIEFDPAAQAHLQPAVSERFVGFWESWLFIGAFAGFESEDFSARNLTIFPGGEPEWAADTLTLWTDDVGVGDAAFACLTNGFNHLHFTCAPIVQLHIY